MESSELERHHFPLLTYWLFLFTSVILYEIFSKSDPYQGEDAREVLQAVADKKICKRPVPPAAMSDKLRSIMKDCLEDDPTQRPSFHELDMRLDRVPLADFQVISASSSVNEASFYERFPPQIAEVMKGGGQPPAEYKDMITLYVQPPRSWKPIKAFFSHIYPFLFPVCSSISRDLTTFLPRSILTKGTI